MEAPASSCRGPLRRAALSAKMKGLAAGPRQLVILGVIHVQVFSSTKAFAFRVSIAFALIAGGLAPSAFAADYPADIDLNIGIKPDPRKGYELLLNEPMAAPIMKVDEIDRLWKIWEPEEKAKAESATPEERRRMTFSRYGWAERDDNSGLPLDYTPDGQGNLVTNCFTCHGGKVAGKTMPGAGNTHVDLTTLATDVAHLRRLESGGDPAAVADVQAPFKTPLNFHRGTTNAVIFAAVFAGLRDPERGRRYIQNPDLLMHHDMNAPAWWNVSMKEKLYADAFAPITPRQLMPFAMSPTFSYEKFKSFEPNFVHIKAYIESLEPPKYPFEINVQLAAKGEKLFVESCAKCHGTYGAGGEFPNKSIPMHEIKTDRRRFDSISRADRESANKGWLQYDGRIPVDLESEGYLAQPLRGIWATAPYLHNGSIPTLHHLFNAEERPQVWKRDENGYDQKRVGVLLVEERDALPEGLNSREKREYYDASRPGAGTEGHLFPDELLNAEEKIAVMEYLKTL